MAPEDYFLSDEFFSHHLSAYVFIQPCSNTCSAQASLGSIMSSTVPDFSRSPKQDRIPMNKAGIHLVILLTGFFYLSADHLSRDNYPEKQVGAVFQHFCEHSRFVR